MATAIRLSSLSPAGPWMPFLSNGLEIYPNFYELSCADPLALGQGLSATGQFSVLALIMSLRSDYPSTR